MKLLSVITIAQRGLRANMGRSVLTMLGIVIGISSVIMLTSLGAGAQSYILGQLKDIGSNQFFIRPGPGDTPNGPPISFNATTLTYNDYLAIKRLPSVEMAAPLVLDQTVVIAGNISHNTTVVGTTPEALKLNNSTMEQGLFFSQEDVRGQNQVAVLGYEVSQKLFPNGHAIGSLTRIGKTNFRIIGTLKEQGTRFFQSLDDRVYVPITVAQKELLGISYVNFIAVGAAADLSVTISDVRALLRARHNIVNPANDLSKDNFKIQSQVEAANTFSSISSVLTAFIAAIAAISLIVGGVGIMNIMLASVSERTREVGLRKSVGATNRNILQQFLVEAVLLTFSGGIIGILLGGVLSFIVGILVRHFAGTWDFVVPFGSVLLALGVSISVGLVFGLYPARKAAKLSPIEALRYE